MVCAIYADRGVEKPDYAPGVPGRVVISVDGSCKGGMHVVLACYRRRWTALGNSEYGCHPLGIARIKEKDKALNHAPLQCFLSQLKYALCAFCGGLQWHPANVPATTAGCSTWSGSCRQTRWFLP